MIVLKISPSSNFGSAPEYIRVYLYRLRIPEPKESANPISLNTAAIAGFFAYGLKSLISTLPIARAILAFSTTIRSLSITNFATYPLE